MFVAFVVMSTYGGSASGTHAAMSLNHRALLGSAERVRTKDGAYRQCEKGWISVENSSEMIIAIAVLAVLVIGALAFFAGRRGQQRKQDQLKQRFGAEYDREVQAQGSVARAEKVLSARERRVHEQHLKTLPEAERVQFDADWRAVQARFVDDPSSAVESADELIKSVMMARGYKVESFDRRVEDLTVEHADVVQHYRAARELAVANREGRANTEEMRQALVHYRALFSDLLAPPQQQRQDRRLQEARV